jgi:hypothetical protein
MTTAMTTATTPVFLDDYLDAPDFPANLTALTGAFGDRIALPTRCEEIGVLCPDVRKAADYLTRERGSGPFFLGEGSPREFTEGGKVTPYTTRIGFGYHRGVLIELAEPGLGSTVFTPEVPSNRVLVDHLGFFARGDNLRRPDRHGADAYFLDRLRGAGYQTQYTALLSVLGLIGRVSIFPTAAETGGVDLEFLDIRLFAKRGPKIRLGRRLLELGARLQIRTGHRLLKIRSHHELPPPASA